MDIITSNKYCKPNLEHNYKEIIRSKVTLQKKNKEYYYKKYS